MRREEQEEERWRRRGRERRRKSPPPPPPPLPKCSPNPFLASPLCNPSVGGGGGGGGEGKGKEKAIMLRHIISHHAMDVAFYTPEVSGSFQLESHVHSNGGRCPHIK